MIVLTWNLFHGRSVPDTPHSLFDEFAAQLAAWEWDVALLQEVPPWWPPRLGEACEASARTALTSRNWLLPITRPLAEWRPDLIKSWGGGANAILVRGDRVLEHRVITLSRLPERRVAHGVRLDSGWWVWNLHAQAHVEARAQADIDRAAAAAIGWAGAAPLVFGGDMNMRAPVVSGFTHVAGHSVDHIFVRAAHAVAPGRTLDRDRLSDHVPAMTEVWKDRPQEAS
jgi:endonuclease/exonuclease/phosphatase family metal-dependent hydrolase